MAGSAWAPINARSRFFDCVVPAIWLVVLTPLFLSRLLGWQLVGCYDEQAFAVVAIVGYIAVVWQSLFKIRSQREQAVYAAAAIRAFLDGCGGAFDWDDFTSCRLSDRAVDHIRRRARDVDLPLDDNGVAALTRLADEAEALIPSGKLTADRNPA